MTDIKSMVETMVDEMNQKNRIILSIAPDFYANELKKRYNFNSILSSQIPRVKVIIDQYTEWLLETYFKDEV
jgi:hypothetical protein